MTKFVSPIAFAAFLAAAAILFTVAAAPLLNIAAQVVA